MSNPLNNPADWAHPLLAFAPTRAAADALFAQIPDNRLYNLTLPTVGLSFPQGMKSSKELSAPRAEVLAVAVQTTDEARRFESDPRRGVRRKLALNLHASDAWVEKVTVKAIREKDLDTLSALAPRVPESEIAAIVALPCSDHELRPIAAALAPRLGKVSTAVAVEVAKAITTRIEAAPQRQRDHIWDVRSAPRMLVDGLAHHEDVVRLAAFDEIAVPLLSSLPSSCVVSPELAAALVASGPALTTYLDQAVSGYRRHDLDPMDAGLGFEAMNPQVAELLLRSGNPSLVAAVASCQNLTSWHVEFILGWLTAASASQLQTARTVAHLLVNPTVLENDSWRDQAVSSAASLLTQVEEGASTNYRPCWVVAEALSADTAVKLADDEVVRLLRAGDANVTGKWLAGRFPATPTVTQVRSLRLEPGLALQSFSAQELLMLVNALRWVTGQREGLDDDEFSTLVSEWGKNLPTSVEYCDAVAELICSPELIRQSVRYSWQAPPGGVPWASWAAIIADRGDDPELWTTVCNLAPTWPSDVVQLADTAAAVSA
jgi:hypothetical protein